MMFDSNTICRRSNRLKTGLVATILLSTNYATAWYAVISSTRIATLAYPTGATSAHHQVQYLSIHIHE